MKAIIAILFTCVSLASHAAECGSTPNQPQMCWPAPEPKPVCVEVLHNTPEYEKCIKQHRAKTLAVVLGILLMD